MNLAGDDQADHKAHGGPDKVVYAYAIEDARWWQQQIGRSLEHGEFGENLTTEGIEVNDALSATGGRSARRFWRYPNHESHVGGWESG